MLTTRADVLLIDCGGWNVSHNGATLELSLAMERVALSRIVLLADRPTDERGLTSRDRTGMGPTAGRVSQYAPARPVDRVAGCLAPVDELSAFELRAPVAVA
jgi:hypothetical protein